MRRIIGTVVLAAAALLCAVAAAEDAEKGYAPVGYTLVFEDDFNGDKLDLDKWFYRDGINRGRTVMPKENVKLKDGALELHCTVEKIRVKPGEHRNHGNHPLKDAYDVSASGIISDWRFSDGYYEARSLLIKARAWHPSFWLERAHADDNNSLLRFANRSEIDIMECEPHRSTEQSIRLHDWVTGGEHRKLPPKGMAKSSNQHTGWFVWGMRLVRDVADFYENGRLVASVKIPKEWSRDPRNIILSCLTLTKPPESGVQRFDWVRYYEPDALRESLVKDCELLRYETSLIADDFVDVRDEKASGGIYQRARNAKKGDHVRYMVHVPEAGRYGIWLNSVVPEGQWQLLIDGKPQGSSVSELGEADFLSAGDYEFKFVSAGGASIGFDSIALVR